MLLFKDKKKIIIIIKNGQFDAVTAAIILQNK